MNIPWQRTHRILGIVRKLLGLEFLGETRDKMHVLIGDIEIEGLDNAVSLQYSNRSVKILRAHFRSIGTSSERYRTIGANYPLVFSSFEFHLLNCYNSVMLRPTDRFKENIFFLMCAGLTFDIEKALEDHDYIAKHIHDITKRPNLKIGRMESLANYRFAIPALTELTFSFVINRCPLCFTRPNIRMVSTFQQGRIFVAGGVSETLFCRDSSLTRICLSYFDRCCSCPQCDRRTGHEFQCHGCCEYYSLIVYAITPTLNTTSVQPWLEARSCAQKPVYAISPRVVHGRTSSSD